MKKREDLQITNIKNKKEHITTDSTKIKLVIKYVLNNFIQKLWH